MQRARHRHRGALAAALVVASCAAGPGPGADGGNGAADQDRSTTTTAVATTLPPASTTSPPAPGGVLVFTETAGYRHGSIPAGVEALRGITGDAGLDMAVAATSGVFTDDGLAGYDAVVFLNTTGDVLDIDQQAAFERYVAAGGGFLGVHAAADAEYEWPWYGRHLGGYFAGHPAVQEGVVRVVAPDHPTAAGVPDPWTVEDEFYSFRDVRSDLDVVLELDEATYDLGAAPSMGERHPISWSHDDGGGRAFYTGLGHTDEMFADPVFRGHLAAALDWVVDGARR